MANILFSRGSLLWLPVLTLAGFFLSRRSFEPDTSSSRVSNIPAGQAADTSKAMDGNWHAPVSSSINNLTSAINSTGTHGFVYNSSTLPEGIPYGTYNWCNMPHVRRSEYPTVNSSYVLEYVEVVHRHHKRTPYASNTFPVETYPWYCDDEALFFYGAPLPAHGANHSTNTFWSVYTSSSNPLAPQGYKGTCQFPQITRGGLDDSWQHGKDLYGVYHDLLGFLPEEYDPDFASFRVTTNIITSQVASMVTSGMFGGKAQQNLPLLIQQASIDSLEPTYPCPAASTNFSVYGIGSDDPAWSSHLKAASDLYANLDSISGVPPEDEGFHASFDHYFDNLSSRLCHAKPLPCNASNPFLCVTEEMANKVFRLGQYEYSYLYRDAGPETLEYSVGSYGIWIAELAENLREATHAIDPVRTGDKKSGSKRYRHNVAHDGSLSRILSILQVEEMVWPGMGSEVVFELYQRKEDQQFYVRVLWGGQVLRSSNPTLGVLDMVPVEILLAYFDKLVGHRAEKIPSICSS